ncbi:MAG TPA: hypothetical protein VFL97_07630 [Nitrococcus sp.]|nr:hypothetical protein [Nitrococcus sp.]
MGGIASGAVAGLAAITPASGFVGPPGSLIIGASAGLACFYAVTRMKPALGYDGRAGLLRRAWDRRYRECARHGRLHGQVAR